MARWMNDVIIEFSPPHEVFWCSKCDCEQVNSQDPATGKFFRVHGHVYDFREKKASPDWPCVVFAICSTCLKQ
jgi:hypothetical protein